MGETVSNLTGQPIPATLAGKDHKFRRLNLTELFGRIEAVVLQEWADRIRLIAQGLSQAERYEFLSHQASHPLSNQQKGELIRAKVNSVSGIEMILGMAHLPEGKEDVLPDVPSLVLEEVEKVLLKSLIGAITGTDGVEVEGGAEDPKAETQTGK